MSTYASFFPPYFSCPFCRFSIFVFLAFSFVFSTLSRKWRRTLFVLELRHLFLRYSVHLVKEIVKLLKKSERWENKWSKVKTLRDKPRSRWPVFFYKRCEKCYRKNCKCMCNNSIRLKGKKKTSTSQYQSFEHNGMEICDQQRLESLEEKKGGAHFMQAWHQKNLQTLYQRTTGRQTHVMRTL